MSAPQTLLVETRDGVRHVTLNRPETRNAMSLAMADELLAALKSAETNGVRAIVLKGAGGHFCSGGDVKDMGAAYAGPDSTEGGPDGQDPAAKVNAQFGHLCKAYAETGLPVIVVLEGAVLGGGFGLACVADVALARETALFRLPETGLGLVPAQIAPFLVERLGYSEARRLAVTGGKIDAQTALSLRLVHGVHEGEEAMNTALEAVLADIRKGAPNAIAETKRLMRRARLHDAGSLIDDAAKVFAAAVRSEEGAEGLTAFIEKRPAKWVQG